LIAATVGNAEHLVDFEHALRDRFLASREHAGELGDVGAHDEHRLTGREDHTLHVGRLGDRLGGGVEVLECRLVELVDRVAGQVELEFDDAVAQRLCAESGSGIEHEESSLRQNLRGHLPSLPHRNRILNRSFRQAQAPRALPMRRGTAALAPKPTARGKKTQQIMRLCASGGASACQPRGSGIT